MNITGNTILVTGGGQGLGRALAEALHARGNQVVIAGRRRETLDEVAAANPGMSAMTLDVADADAIAPFAAALVDAHPALNVVVHNAGIMRAEDLAGDYRTDDAEATIATNLLGPIRLTATLLPHLKAQGAKAEGSATIVTVSSGLAFVPLVATPTYCATKAAIHSWSQSLRAQLAGAGVGVVEIIPPSVQSDLMPGHADDPNAMPLADWMAETMALLEAQPDAHENGVARLAFLRNAEREGRWDQAFAALNGR